MLKAIFGYQMKLTVNLTVKMIVAEKLLKMTTLYKRR